MKENKDIENFLSAYNEKVVAHIEELRGIILGLLPGVIEQLDLPARMIAYCYGQKYIDMVCTLIPSRKGLKLGFYKGVDLPDPDNLLQGKGKISRYIEIKTADDIQHPGVTSLIEEAFAAYKVSASKS